MEFTKTSFTLLEKPKGLGLFLLTVFMSILITHRAHTSKDWPFGQNFVKCGGGNLSYPDRKFTVISINGGDYGGGKGDGELDFV